MKPGESFEIGGYTLALRRRRGARDAAHRVPHGASRGARRRHADRHAASRRSASTRSREQPTTEVAIRSTLGADLYLVLGSYDEASQMATILAYVNPLVSWLWWGGIVLALGTVVTIIPSRAPAPATGLRRGTRCSRHGHGMSGKPMRKPALATRVRCVSCAPALARPGLLARGQAVTRRRSGLLPGHRGIAHLPVRLWPDRTRCNHLQCGSAIPLREEIRAQMSLGKSREQILALLQRQVRREDPLGADHLGLQRAGVGHAVRPGRTRRHCLSASPSCDGVLAATKPHLEMRPAHRLPYLRTTRCWRKS